MIVWGRGDLRVPRDDFLTEAGVRRNHGNAKLGEPHSHEPPEAGAWDVRRIRIRSPRPVRQRAPEFGSRTPEALPDVHAGL